MRNCVRRREKFEMEDIQHSIAEPATDPAKPLNVERSHWLLLNSGLCAPAFNMALDEALLEFLARLGKPVLRLYGWTEPAATFGYFQKFAEIERATLLRPLIRRPTGGGLVPHDADWTYSLAFPAGHEWYLLRAEESYRRAHEWIQAAFTRLDIPTNLAPQSRSSPRVEALSEIRNDQSHLTSAATKEMPGECFVGHEKSDLLWQGRKIAGAAQRRTRAGLLIQGSVQPPPVGLRRADWEKAMVAVMRRTWEDFQPDAALCERTAWLGAQKYSQAAFLKKR